jgi:hypothetical protein
MFKDHFCKTRALIILILENFKILPQNQSKINKYGNMIPKYLLITNLKQQISYITVKGTHMDFNRAIKIPS